MCCQITGVSGLCQGLHCWPCTLLLLGRSSDAIFHAGQASSAALGMPRPPSPAFFWIRETRPLDAQASGRTLESQSLAFGPLAVLEMFGRVPLSSRIWYSFLPPRGGGKQLIEVPECQVEDLYSDFELTMVAPSRVLSKSNLSNADQEP